MDKWEYTELDLNQVPKRRASIDVLNEAGIQGWELVNITVTNQAILKRLVPNKAPQAAAKAKASQATSAEAPGGAAALMPRRDRV